MLFNGKEIFQCRIAYMVSVVYMKQNGHKINGIGVDFKTMILMERSHTLKEDRA